jgi:hypothetical protein
MIYIGIDDTDNPECGGTGRVARELAALLRQEYPVPGVSRHQFLVDPRIPYTSNNSGNVIHVGAEPSDLEGLTERLIVPLLDRCLEGSDPGLCVAGARAASHPFGRAAQVRLVTQEEARAAAAEVGAILRGLGGTRDGMIGAMAAVVLAAGGEDGRFVEVGRCRDLSGWVSVCDLLAAGVSDVRTPAGDRAEDGEVDTLGGRVRPVLREGRPVLLVEPTGAGTWRVVEQGKGRGRHREEAECLRS